MLDGILDDVGYAHIYIRDFRMQGSRCVREAKLELGSVQGRSRQTHDEENLTEVCRTSRTTLTSVCITVS